MSPFNQFFRAATGNDPYPFQIRFADADRLPHLLRAPTGAGKTATAVLGWLWRWLERPKDTPRRLVYCLPMRVLVEQSAHAAKLWVKNLVDQKALPDAVLVHMLMGGIETEDWHLYPEKPAILIGTQDMLLSRALNRGYAESRFHWPIDFGLLNNDCLWVFDEPQLMGSGVSTSAQLAGLREALGTFKHCPSVWMSATLEECWLGTVDFRGKFTAPPLELGSDRYGDDYEPGRPLSARMTAKKTLAPLGLSLSKEADDKEAKALGAKVLEKHREGEGKQTLVVLNTVKRAKKLYAALLDLRKKAKGASPKLLLVHSRFRPIERRLLNDQLQQGGDQAADRIIVATQVVEAGVDISARTLVTELAPWASVVQRIGRCNRTGHDGPGRVFWIDLDVEKQAAPYTAEELVHARQQLEKLAGADVSPKALADFKEREGITLPFEHQHVLRRRDLIDLFDTSPDLSGNDIDVSRFVRGDESDSDVQVFWRDVPASGPPADEPSPHRDELCSVPIGELRTFLKTKGKLVGYFWDHLDDQWRQVRDNSLRPGLTVLLPVSAAGYSWDREDKTGRGWDPDSSGPADPVEVTGQVKEPEEGTTSDPKSSGQPRPWTIADHTANVFWELDALLKALPWLPDNWQAILRDAALWHDLGKAHWAFQEGVRKANPDLDGDQLWAKSGKNGRLRHGRKYFRHELASALAVWQLGKPFEVAYLIATHHGKVRLSIRSVPGEDPPEDTEAPFALGVHHKDKLKPVTFATGERSPEVVLDLTPMTLGADTSWSAQALALRDQVGPFRLAYLEALLRSADERASRKEKVGSVDA